MRRKAVIARNNVTWYFISKDEDYDPRHSDLIMKNVLHCVCNCVASDILDKFVLPSSRRNM